MRLEFWRKQCRWGVLDSNYGGYDNLITKMGYSYISLKRYRKMLEAHPEWEAMLDLILKQENDSRRIRKQDR